MYKQYLSILLIGLIALTIGVIETVIVSLNTDALYPVFMVIIPSFLCLALVAEKITKTFGSLEDKF